MKVAAKPSGALLMPKCDDGIESGGLEGRPDTKEESDADCHHKARADGPERDTGRKRRYQISDDEADGNAGENPEHTADLVSCAVLPGAVERQRILETVDVEERLRWLITFLLNEIATKKKGHN